MVRAPRNILRERAFQFEEMIDRYLLDKTGFLRSALIKTALEPFPDGYFSNGERNCLKISGYEHLDHSRVMNYENSGMVQGEFLSAMCCRYRASGETEALQKASRTFGGIRRIYEMSQAVTKGFLCKPWGGEVTDEISSDQCLYTIFALDDYYPLAGKAEQAQIREMIEMIALFWKNVKYSYKYYGEMLHWQKCRFMIFMTLAYKYSGRKEFLDEFRELDALEKGSREVPFNASMDVKGATCPQWKNAIGNHLLRQSSPAVLSAALSVIPLLETTYADQEFYLDKLRKIIDFGHRSIAPDGSTYGYLLCDPRTGETKPLDKVVQYGADPRWHFFGFAAPYRCGGMGGAMYAAALQNAAKYLSDVETEKSTRDILMKLDQQRLTWFDDPDGVFPPELYWMTNVFSGDAIGCWLWAYWKSVEQHNE